MMQMQDKLTLCDVQSLCELIEAQSNVISKLNDAIKEQNKYVERLHQTLALKEYLNEGEEA